MIIVQQNIGSTPRITLAFSTCVTLHSFHGFGASSFPYFPIDVDWMAALSKNLHRINFSVEC